jgi:hypothetical protein
VIRPTEYQVMKRLMFARKDFDPQLKGHTVNVMIWNACDRAFTKLDDHQRELVTMQSNRLVKKCHGLGAGGSLELLAAIGDVIGGCDG